MAPRWALPLMVGLFLVAKALAAPYIDPLTLTAISEAQESALFGVEQVWLSVVADTVTTQPLWSSFMSVYDYDDSTMVDAVSRVQTMLGDQVQMAGADDKFRSLLAPLPTEVFAFWASLADERNGAFATALNDLQDPYATPTVPTKLFARAVSVPTPTAMNTAAAATTADDSAATSQMTFDIAATSVLVSIPSESSVSLSSSATPASHTISTIAIAVPCAVAGCMIAAILGVAEFRRRAKRKRRDAEEEAVDDISAKRLKNLETEHFLMSGRGGGGGGSMIYEKHELDAGRDGLPPRPKQNARARPGELEAGGVAVAANRSVDRSTNRSPAGSEDDDINDDDFVMMGGGLSDDSSSWASTMSSTDDVRATLFELPTSSTRNNSPTYAREVYGR